MEYYIILNDDRKKKATPQLGMAFILNGGEDGGRSPLLYAF